MRVSGPLKLKNTSYFHRGVDDDSAEEEKDADVVCPIENSNSKKKKKTEKTGKKGTIRGKLEPN